MTYRLTWETTWIDNQSDLEKIIPSLFEEEHLSVDTETSGWQTGNETLALLQIAAPSKEHIYLIDVLAFPEWTSVGPVISEAKPSMIAHNAPFEQRQFARFDIKTRGTIDTLKMAKNLRGDLPNHTLKTCCKFVLGIDIDKEQQVSDWSQRPLTDEQLEYAALDTEVTYKLFEELAAMEAKLTIEQDKDVPALMQELYQTELHYFMLIQDQAAEMELLKLRKDMLRDAVRAKLIDGAEPYQGEYGSASIQRVRQTEINPEKVRELMPEIAELAIKESVQKQRLKELIEEYGVSKDLVDQVTETIRHNDRLKLKLADF